MPRISMARISNVANSHRYNQNLDASTSWRASIPSEDETLQEILLSWGAQLERWARSVPLRFAIFAVTVLFVLAIIFMTPAFQTNDDAVMCMIVSGQGLTLTPDEHMVFSNVIVGKILKTLYTYLPRMHWYGWYLVATQWTANIALLYCFLRPRYTRLKLVGFAAYFFTAGIYFLVNLQFTSTSILAELAGGMLLLQLVGQDSKGRRESFLLAAAACLLMVWGGLIRSDVIPLAALLIGPVLLVNYWLGTPNRFSAVCACLSIAMVAGLTFFAERYHQDCYSDPQWQAFYQYNPLRVKFNDEQWVKYTRETKPVFDQVGWSKNDYDMILNWYFDDPLFDQEKLNTILNSYPWLIERDLAKALRTTFRDMWRPSTVKAICLMLPAMLLFVDWRKRRFWPSAVTAINAAVIILAIAIFRKAPPERVFMPVLAFPWLVLLHSMTPCWRLGEDHRRTLTRITHSTLTLGSFKIGAVISLDGASNSRCGPFRCCW